MKDLSSSLKRSLIEFLCRCIFSVLCVYIDIKDPIMVKSSIRYLMFFCRCPILCTIKMKYTVSLRSDQDKYTNLPSMMYSLIPLRPTAKEVLVNLDNIYAGAYIYSTFFRIKIVLFPYTRLKILLIETISSGYILIYFALTSIRIMDLEKLRSIILILLYRFIINLSSLWVQINPWIFESFCTVGDKFLWWFSCWEVLLSYGYFPFVDFPIYFYTHGKMGCLFLLGFIFEHSKWIKGEIHRCYIFVGI